MAILIHPRVEVAVFEWPVEDILLQGLPCERCDVAVVTGGGRTPSNGDHNESTERRALQVVVEAVAPGGTAILNADDPHSASLAVHCPGAVVYIARAADNPTLARHRGAKGRAVFVRDGGIRLAEGGTEEELLPLARVPLAHPDNSDSWLESVLAAVAAAWALRLPREALAAGLDSFPRP
jgi:cyanophycin synthetase